MCALRIIYSKRWLPPLDNWFVNPCACLFLVAASHDRNVREKAVGICVDVCLIALTLY